MADAPEPSNSPSASRADATGTNDLPLLFGRYRVERELGRGGMGRVLLAFDTKLRIHVAVKLVPDQLMADAEAADDLRREVLRGIALSHPAIVRTHTFEQDESGAAIVMEYIDGLTFTEWKTQQPGHCFDCEQLLPWLGPLCEVLDYAHREARIVHRDLKPRNIMISQEGKLKVADFGIAATLTDSHSRLTGHANMSGTPAYMSPQQARGKKPSHLDDVYSLGATIYDLIAGKPPFFRGSGETILLQVVAESAPTMAERREELFISGKAPIPEHWEQTIAACLAKDPAERPQSCGEVLARLLTPAPAPEPVPTPHPLKPTNVIAPEPVKKPIVRVTAPREPVPSPSSVSRQRRGKWLAFTAAALVVVAAVATALHFGKRTKSEGTNTTAENSSHPGSAISPSTATKEKPFVNSLGMKFVPVPGTNVLFCIWETRVRDYEQFANEVAVSSNWKNRKWDEVPNSGGPDHPASPLSWEDANLFCNWLTERETAAGKLPKGAKYRLPTDEEWSRAVGLPPEVGDTPKERSDKKVGGYPWGDQWPPPPNAANLQDETFHEAFPKEKDWVKGYTDGYATTAPAGSFPPNALGLYDLSGNVSEWCSDWFDAARERRVQRGGAWYNLFGSGSLLSSSRFAYLHSYGNDPSGFRCVLAPSASVAPAAPTGTAKTPASPTPTPTAPTVAAAPSTPAPSRTTPKPLSEIDKWLAQVEAIYQPKWQSEVVGPYESGLDELRKNTLTALDTQIANASRSARLNDALAFRNDRQRIENDQGVPADDNDNPPAALKSLRAAWRSQIARLETDRRQHAQTVYGQYDQVLATNQAALTQRQRLDEALQLQQRREALKVEWLAPPPRPGTPAFATKERPFVNSLGMKFVPVPITGGPTNGQRVLFSIWETRVQDWEAFCKGNGRGFSGSAGFNEAPTHAAVFMSWTDAGAFCRWLTLRDQDSGLLSANQLYRLPTDHEWSCAVGIGGREDAGKLPGDKDGRLIDVFPWGDTWPPPSGSGNYAGEELQPSITPKNYWWVKGVISGFRDPFVETAPVGSFAANRFGLFDLEGNVEEWVEEWMSEGRRTTRGGSWAFGERRWLNASRRGSIGVNAGTNTLGFRCVLVSTTGSASTSDSTGPARTAVAAPAPTPFASPMPRPGVAPATPTPHPASAAVTRPDAAPASTFGMGGQAPRLPGASPSASGALALQKATKDAPFVNSLGMKFVPVPGTKVLFCIHETRRQDYAAYDRETPGVDGSWKNAKDDGVPYGTGDDYPVAHVSWEEAQAFCVWLSKKEAVTYRLPTDREWSYAVGIGSEERRTKETTPQMLNDKVKGEYPWGKKWPPPPGAGNFADATWHAQSKASAASIEGYEDGFATTAPVMSFAPNKIGLYDLAGNVAEYVGDWLNSEQKAKVLRGGSFNVNVESWLLSSHRFDAEPTRQWGAVTRGHGFRCVVELPAR